MLGVRSAGTIMELSSDPNAMILQQCDIGMVGDWKELPLICIVRLKLRPVLKVPEFESRW